MYELKIEHIDSGSAARVSSWLTPRGTIDLPAFMPVGTQGTVKGLTVDQLHATGARVILGNTYHLAIRPGVEVVASLGGLHRFMGWNGPILTDSGGFQIFSLADSARISERGAVFRSHVDGATMELTPERAMEIQALLASDVAMVLDHVVRLPSPAELVREATERSVRWALRCRQQPRASGQAVFGIVQGGLDRDLRAWCTGRLVEMDFEGYAIGGLSVGEDVGEMYSVLDVVCPTLPADKPRYLMGVGRPADLLEAVARGVDLFDCVMPTRNGRNALAFTDIGPLRLRNQRFQFDDQPLAPDCPCVACRHAKGYLRHLFMAGEMLGPVLLSIHNLTYYQRLLQGARQAIREDRFREFAAHKFAGWGSASVA